jgi:transposase
MLAAETPRRHGIRRPPVLDGCGIDAVIPRRSLQQAGEQFDKKFYCQRNRIELAVRWLKECRRIATRYDMLGLNFLAFTKHAIILKYPGVLDYARPCLGTLHV